jgi:HD-GYP domain-containing protein (c-di-GMP phosphodiesterase class II)
MIYWSEGEVFKYIRENSGSHIDPKVVTEFFIMRKHSSSLSIHTEKDYLSAINKRFLVV